MHVRKRSTEPLFAYRIIKLYGMQVPIGSRAYYFRERGFGWPLLIFGAGVDRSCDGTARSEASLVRWDRSPKAGLKPRPSGIELNRAVQITRAENGVRLLQKRASQRMIRPRLRLCAEKNCVVDAPMALPRELCARTESWLLLVGPDCKFISVRIEEVKPSSTRK